LLTDWAISDAGSVKEGLFINVAIPGFLGIPLLHPIKISTPDFLGIPLFQFPAKCVASFDDASEIIGL